MRKLVGVVLVSLVLGGASVGTASAQMVYPKDPPRVTCGDLCGGGDGVRLHR